jgi:hypothetical protein
MNGLSLFTLLFKETNIKPGSEDIPGRLEVVCEDTNAIKLRDKYLLIKYLCVYWAIQKI